MFNKLRLQFIFTNIAIVFTLFFLITTGAYFLLQTNLINHTQFFAKRMADGINSGIFPDFPSFDAHVPKPEDGKNPGGFHNMPPFNGRMPKPPGGINAGGFRNFPPPVSLMPKVFFCKNRSHRRNFFPFHQAAL